MERENYKMSEDEFEVLDQLYFVTSFTDLVDSSGLTETTLLLTLSGLIARQWVKCFVDPDHEVEVTSESLAENYNKFQYLATKQGLLAHNMR